MSAVGHLQCHSSPGTAQKLIPPPPSSVAATVSAFSPPTSDPSVPGHLWKVSSAFCVFGHKPKRWVFAQGSGAGSARASSSKGSASSTSLDVSPSRFLNPFSQACSKPMEAPTQGPEHASVARGKAPKPNSLNKRIRVSAFMLVPFNVGVQRGGMMSVKRGKA